MPAPDLADTEVQCVDRVLESSINTFETAAATNVRSAI